MTHVLAITYQSEKVTSHLIDSVLRGTHGRWGGAFGDQLLRDAAVAKVFGRFEREPERRESVAGHDLGVGAVAEEDVDEGGVVRLHRHVQRRPVQIWTTALLKSCTVPIGNCWE